MAPRHLNHATRILIAILNAVLFVRVLAYSWVTDDAFITFRSVQNFIAGYGPVFNVGERVQSYTHPLWFFILSLGGLVGINLYFWAIFLGLIFTGCALVLLYKSYRHQGALPAYVLALLVLIFSESFLSFQTSGLENSLLNLLLAIFIYQFAKTDHSIASSTCLFLTSSLILLTRLDQLFLLAPLLIYVFWKTKASFFRSLVPALVGWIPIVLWEIFSLIYYGAVFPNTKYAKTGGRGLLESIDFGCRYLSEYVQTEVAFGIVFILMAYAAIRMPRQRLVGPAGVLWLAILLAFAYVIAVGGDFMRGRFFTGIMFSAMFMLVLFPVGISISKWRAIVLLTLFGIIAGFSWYFIAFKENMFSKHSGMGNERNFYKEYLALNFDPRKSYERHPWGVAGQAMNMQYAGQQVTIVGVNGQRGYWCGPNISLIDLVGLTDPMVARMPLRSTKRTGHFEFDIPEEYLIERTQNCRIATWKDERKQELWDHIRMVTQSKELFTWERFRSIYWLTRYARGPRVGAIEHFDQ